MTTTDTPTRSADGWSLQTDQAIKAKHRAIWASGDYPALARRIAGLGKELVGAIAPRAGERVLDVAAGTGNASIPAALAGAAVVASDLTPELFEAGRSMAADRGATLTWEQGDAEDLPYQDASFDVVMSCIGVMFAPRHQRAAAEMLRVLHPDGRLGLLSWTPEGLVGQLFATMKPYAPPPPAGAQPPPLWGAEEHVRGLLGDQVTDVQVRKGSLRVGFDSGAQFLDYFKSHYGPTISVYDYLRDHPDRADELDASIAALADRFGASSGTFDWEYLLVTATRS